jgi:hypothetical protein
MVICLLAALSVQGQSSITAAFGGGVGIPVGVTNDHAGTGFSFVASAGPRFNRYFSGTVDFNFEGASVDVLQNASTNTQVDAQMYIWGLTLNPNLEFIHKERFISYATAGYGIYNRWLELTRTTITSTVVCDPWWGICSNGIVNGEVFAGVRSTYKGGFNAGAGVAFGAKKRTFVEGRYHRMLTTNRPTEFVSAVFGIRWH